MQEAEDAQNLVKDSLSSAHLGNCCLLRQVLQNVKWDCIGDFEEQPDINKACS